jgi:hypothetical protein
MRGNLSILSLPFSKLETISLRDVALLRTFIKDHEVHACMFSGSIQKVSSFDSLLGLFEEALSFSGQEKFSAKVQSLSVNALEKPSRSFLSALKSSFYELDQVNLLLLRSKLNSNKRGILFYVFRLSHILSLYLFYNDFTLES